MSSYWIRSGLFTLFEKLSVQAFGLGSSILLFRIFDKNTIGVWFIFLAITSILEVSRVGILQNALVKYLVDTEGETYRKISTASLVLNVTFTVISILLIVVGAPYVSYWLEMPQLENLLYIYIATTVILLPFIQSNYTQQANLDFRGVFWANFVKQGLFFVVIATTWFLGGSMDLTQLAIYQLLGAFFGAIVAIVMAKKYLRFSRTVDPVWMKELFRFGRYVFGTNLATMLFKNTDKFLIGRLVGAPAVALYEAAIKVTNLVDIPTQSMANILYPQSARRSAEGTEGVRKLYEKAVGAVLAILTPIIIFVFVFPQPFILLLSGSEYMDAVPLLRVTILFGFFIPYATNFGTVLDSIGRPATNFLFTVTYMLVNVGVIYLFAKNYGVMGAAIGTLITFFIAFIAMQVYLYRSLGVNPINPWAEAIGFYKRLFGMVKSKFQKGTA